MQADFLCKIIPNMWRTYLYYNPSKSINAITPTPMSVLK